MDNLATNSLIALLGQGWVIGALVGMPVGPVVVLLLRIGLLSSWRQFSKAAFLTGLSLALSVLLALLCVEFIRDFIERFPFYIHAGLGCAVLGLAINAYRSNQKINLQNLDQQQVQLTAPAILSLFCPFTAILIFNLLAVRHIEVQTMGVVDYIFFLFGSTLGQYSVFTFYNGILRCCTKMLSKKYVLWMTKIAPFVLMCYGLQGLYKAFLAV